MMAHVIGSQIAEDPPFERKVVHGIMCDVVEQISCNQAGHDGCGRRGAERKVKKEIKEGTERQAHGRHHYQAQRVGRIVVVNTMKGPVDALTPFGFRMEMEDETMHRVFDEGPDDHAGEKQPADGYQSKPVMNDGKDNEQNNDRYVNDKRYRPMYA